MPRERNEHEMAAGSIERDLALFNAFIEAERGPLLRQARRRRARATHEQQGWVERPLLGPKEMERRLEEGFEALIGRMDPETAAATTRLVTMFAAVQAPMAPERSYR